MKILHLELGRHLYGGAKQVCYLIDALTALGIDEQLLACAHNSEIATLPMRGAKTLPLRYAGEWDGTIVARLAALIRNERPDILHVHSRRGADVWGAIVAKSTGIPAICTRRVDNPEGTLARLKYAQYQAVVSISAASSTLLAHTYPNM